MELTVYIFKGVYNFKVEVTSQIMQETYFYNFIKFILRTKLEIRFSIGQ